MPSDNPNDSGRGATHGAGHEALHGTAQGLAGSLAGDLSERRFDGRYSDGTNARSYEVETRLTANGVVIHKAGDANPIFWPYSGLSLAEPIREHSIDSLVACADHYGATLFVPGTMFARALAGVAPQLTARSERWRNTRPWLMAAGAFALLVAFVYVADLSPARYTASLIPENVRSNLGKRSMKSLIGDHGVCVATKGREALDRLVARLSKASGNDTPIHVSVADWGLLNAFTTPGARIVVTRKLIVTARTPDELAGVLAHEIGHGISLHPETAVVRAVGLSLMIELMSGGSGSTVANVGLLLAQLSYTRSAEREADDEALRILMAAAIAPDGLETFFKRISGSQSASKKDKGAKKKDEKAKKAEKAKKKASSERGKTMASDDEKEKKADAKDAASRDPWGGALDILSTHPLTDERLARVRAQPDYAATPAMSAADWTALRAICSKTRGGKRKLNSSDTSKW